MPNLTKKYHVVLTAGARAELSALVRRTSAGAGKVRRATILLMADEAHPDGGYADWEIAEEVVRLTAPGYHRGEGLEVRGRLAQEPKAAVQDLQRIGSLIYSHLLTEPARKKLRTADPCALYLRLDEQLIHIPWELCHDGKEFLATKFQVGRQVIGASVCRHESGSCSAVDRQLSNDGLATHRLRNRHT